jgi:hypothetical protein
MSMYATRSSSPLGWIACGRGLRRSKQAFAAMSEYDLWVPDHGAIEDGPRPDRNARARQLGGDDSSPEASAR